MKVIIDKKYRWKQYRDEELKYWYIGSEKAVKTFISSCQRNPLAQGKKLRSELFDLFGCFAVIVQQEKQIIAAVDKIRSYPIFYVHEGNKFAISNSARALKNQCNLSEIDELSLLEFRTAGYVTGRETLYSNLYQLQAGEFLIWHWPDAKMERERYYLFYSPSNDKMSLADGIDQLNSITEKVFMRMVHSLNARTALVPLSAGLDSRLVACMLKKLGYQNVTCYAYGSNGNWEARASKEIARRLGYKWLFAPYDRKNVRASYRTKDMERYFAFSDGLSSLPFIQDRLAIIQLSDRGQIPDDAVFINGNSGDFSTGGHIPNALMQESPNGLEKLFGAIINKHYSLWESLKTKRNLALISEKINRILYEVLNQYSTPQDELSLPALYELWEWQERQSKFVVNGQRVYDYLGYSWSLPHWDDLYLDFWSRVAPPLKFQQKLYKSYLEKKDLFGLFRTFQTKSYITPPIIRPIRFLGKALSFPFGKNSWHRIEKNFYSYFTDDMQTYCCFPYLKIATSIKGFRSAVSFRSESHIQRIIGKNV